MTPAAEDYLVHQIASLAVEAMLYEVSATPKPGLVDRRNCGAHSDMDFFTFMSSTAALHSSFDAMVRTGIRHRGDDPRSMWAELRREGMTAEERMFAHTCGVNTHKGEIFSLGLLCGCAGWLLGKKKPAAKEVLLVTARMSRGLCEQAFSGLKTKEMLTKGEQMYLKYGCTGARGEAEEGYPMVREAALPLFRELMQKGICVNDAMVQTLLFLIAGTTDTNILSRHDMETAQYAKQCAAEAIRLGGIFTEEGKMYIDQMDQDFISRNISPGGSADLLAVTFFLYQLEKTDYIAVRI